MQLLPTSWTLFPMYLSLNLTENLLLNDPFPSAEFIHWMKLPSALHLLGFHLFINDVSNVLADT